MQKVVKSIVDWFCKRTYVIIVIIMAVFITGVVMGDKPDDKKNLVTKATLKLHEDALVPVGGYLDKIAGDAYDLATGAAGDYLSDNV